MSDYKHEKIVRLPFPKDILKRCSTEDVDDCCDYLKDKLGELWENREKNSFQIGYSDSAYYIDWCYYSTYGEETGEWGNVRLLTEKELEIITPYFDKLGVVYEDEDLRVIDYCYYNCAEPDDYYHINLIDHSSIFIN